jgi:DNA adenine methylase
MSKRFLTPLRYPGGKGKFAPFIESIIETNGLVGGHYLEVYAGGAAIALDLLFKGYVSDVHINDFDPAVAAFWLAAVNHSEELIERIHDVQITMENWYKYKEIMEDENHSDWVERGFATFFMNRCNRSGILKGGVIGGKAQAGEWKLDARFKKENLIPRFKKIQTYKEHIHVYCEDANALLKRCGGFLPSDRSLIYLDPPYYVKGQGLYRNFYEHDDHVQIKETLSCLDTPWVVSYDDVSEIRHIYKGSDRQKHVLTYTAQEKKIGNEILFFSPGMTISVDELRKSA